MELCISVLRHQSRTDTRNRRSHPLYRRRDIGKARHRD
jgi:hypothetical protein